jgi:hypothetical protein
VRSSSLYLLLLLLRPGRETPPRYQREVAHVRQKDVQPTPHYTRQHPLHRGGQRGLHVLTRKHAQQYKVRYRQREREREREGGRGREREGAKRAENFCVLKSDVLQGIGYLLTHDEWIFGSTAADEQAAHTLTRRRAGVCVCNEDIDDVVLPSTDELHQLRFMLMFRPNASDAQSCSNKTKISIERRRQRRVKS